MTLDEYKMWYVHDEGHWYVSKVKQYKPSAIQEFAKGLSIIESVFNANKDSKIYSDYHIFKPKDPTLLFKEKKIIRINEYSIFFTCLLFLQNNLIDQAHLQTVNKKKFLLFSTIQKEFIEGNNYEYFIKKYTKPYLVNEFTVYYRNFKSWLGKYGFYGEYENKTAFITEMGYEFIKNKDKVDVCSALFLHQIKRYQFWNPTIEQKYKDYKIRPYYLLLDVINRLPGKYFTKTEFALFITKIKNHSEKAITDQIQSIKTFRKLGTVNQKEFIKELNLLDKKKFRKRERTNYESLIDSAAKEINCYGYGGLIQLGKGKDEGNYILMETASAKDEMDLFSHATKFIDFKDKLDWIAHLGAKEGIPIESMIEMYLINGISIENIREELKKTNQTLNESLDEILYEKEVEEYYVNNIKELHMDLEVVNIPRHGRQFSTHIGPIDILCRDKKTKEYVICELKRGHTSDETVGQILRYMGWVKRHLEESDREVRGILVGSNFSEKIDYSFEGIQNENINKLIKKHIHPFNSSNRPKI